MFAPSTLMALGDKSLWLPGQHSTVAGSVDGLFMFILYYSAFFTVLIVALLLFFVWKYRARPGHKAVKTSSHNLALELGWSIPPSLFLIVMFFWGMNTYLDMNTMPADAYKINVSAAKWSWSFTYPQTGLVTGGELHVPVNTDVELTLRSEDVIHSLFIPAFRVKKDVVPGRYTKLWFNATDTGRYHLFCAEYCGTEHSSMMATVVVDTPEDFAKWMAKETDIFNDAEGNARPLSEVGKILHDRHGCAQCHSQDGSKITGPSFKGAWGRTSQFTDGTSAVVDENYIRESLINPNGKVVTGYQAVMPTYKGKLSDREIDALIEYLKTIQ